MDKMLDRICFAQQTRKQLEVHPVVALLGPRQCGKTTLAKKIIEDYSGNTHSFDLEDPADILALSEPMRVLERLSGLVIIDEIQRLPDLFPILRVLVDKKQAQYLILGSASRHLIQQSSETLAGRIGYIELTPFQLQEVKLSSTLLIRGGFPRAYLAKTEEHSYLWREAYIQTFLEQDIPNLGFRVPALMLRRFWMMLSHVHGQLLNMHALGNSLSISGHTVRHYLDILSGTFMIRVMPPWHSNIKKRQVKTPKIFFRDSGVLLTLLGIQTEEALLRHPQLGAIWEGFALEQLITYFDLRAEEAFFWRTAQGAELDLFVFLNGKPIGFEFKFSDAPKVTKSMHQALSDLALEHLYIIYPGKRSIPLGDKITALGLDTAIEMVF
ncbi:MAG: ATP-binding protein [Legionella sp.]|nr:ATP-binding protein [Legionella sp.]